MWSAYLAAGRGTHGPTRTPGERRADEWSRGSGGVPAGVLCPESAAGAVPGGCPRGVGGWCRPGAGPGGGPPRGRGRVFGGVLLSHPVAGAVPSALRGLASGFGMVPGVSLSPWPPKRCEPVRVQPRRSCRLRAAQWTRTPRTRVTGGVWSSPRPISTGQLQRLTALPLPAYQPAGLGGGLTRLYR